MGKFRHFAHFVALTLYLCTKHFPDDTTILTVSAGYIHTFLHIFLRLVDIHNKGDVFMDYDYNDLRAQIGEIDRKIKCLSSSLSVIGDPEMLDSVNYQLLSLKTRKLALFKQIRQIYVSGK